MTRSLRGRFTLLIAAGGTALIAMFGAELGAAQQAAVATTAAPTNAGSIAGSWMNAEYKFTGLPPAQRTIQTSNGKAPPLLPWAAKLLDQRVKDAVDGKVYANTLSQCLPGGIPQMVFGAAYPIQIVESPKQVTILYEEQNHFRTIPLNAVHQDDPDPSFMGDSIGHWEGDTLVVDTIGLKDRTTLDMVGTPHTNALHVVERYRRIAADRLEVRVTIVDKGTFSEPWEARTTYKPADQPMTEYICENNRNAPDAEGHTGFTRR